MNKLDAIAVRICARERGKAIVVRDSYAISADPAPPVGIVLVRVVSEEMVQAIAYGRLDSPPHLLARLDPLSRDASDLEPFANWLAQYLDTCEHESRLPRIWVPHRAALDCLDILGHRYAHNETASPSLQRMGQICRVMAEEARFTGQQAVAVVLDLLRQHVVTGMMPIEEGHLGAVLAWISPVTGRPVREVAEERALTPVSGVLKNTPACRDDEKIERLRKERKKLGATRAVKQTREIREILERAVSAEWDLMLDGRRALMDMNLVQPDYHELVEASRERVSWQLRNGVQSPRAAIALARRLESYEHSLDQAEMANLRNDRIYRVLERRRGIGFEAALVSVSWLGRRVGEKPCRLIVRSDQDLVRVRVEEKISTPDAGIKCIVESIDQDPDTGARRLTLRVETGVRKVRQLTFSELTEWIPCNDFPIFLRQQSMNRVKERAHWVVEGQPMPAAIPLMFLESLPTIKAK